MKDMFHHVHLVPIVGGYALHLGDCECEERKEGPVVTDEPAAISVADAASLHIKVTATAAPPHIVRRPCARAVPMHEHGDAPCQAARDSRIQGAAAEIWKRASRAAEEQDELVEKMAADNRSGATLFAPQVAAAAVTVGCANYYAICVGGVSAEPTGVKDAERVVISTEATVRDAAAVVLGENGTGTEVAAARLFLRGAQRALARLNAYHALRDSPVNEGPEQ